MREVVERVASGLAGEEEEEAGVEAAPVRPSRARGDVRGEEEEEVGSGCADGEVVGLERCGEPPG